MADWEEIKRLAADFQRTQTSDTLQRISERNCIDIIKKLTELKLIDLIYTCDGKEFLTPNHLFKEVEDEVYVNGGRVQLHDVATVLGVDYQHVENTAKTLVAEKPQEYSLILGQIIHSSYKATLEKQIHDTLIATGQLSIAEFAKTLDLPSEFLSKVVKELLPRVMDDYVSSQDERTYYTKDMMDRYKSIIAGTLTAITKPTNIASLMKKLDIPERLFMPIMDSLVKGGRVDATVENRIYTPSIYTREQNDWVDKFYSANSYVSYDLLTRKDIKQPKAFLKKRFPEGVPLQTCFVSPTIVLQVESTIEDCIATNDRIDISTIVPPSLQTEDIDMMLQNIFERNERFKNSCIIVNQTDIISLSFVAAFKDYLNVLVESESWDKTRKSSQAVQKTVSNKDEGVQVLDEITDKTKDGNPAEVQPEVKPEKVEVVPKSQDLELTAEDLKRERRQKKRKGGSSIVVEALDSDDEVGVKKSESGKKSGGARGREIKQKAVKKKYFASKEGKKKNDDQFTSPSEKKSFDNVQLKTCSVSSSVVQQVESMIADCIENSERADLSSIFPSLMRPEDVDMMLHEIFKRNKHFTDSCLVINQTNICGIGFITKCKKSHGELVETKEQLKRELEEQKSKETASEIDAVIADEQAQTS